MARPDLTARQRRILDTIRAAVAERGYPPSLRELCAATGISSSSTAAAALRVLAARGYIAVDPGVPRGIRLLDSPDDEPITMGDLLAELGRKLAAESSHGRLDRCPGCGADLAIVGLTRIVYTWESCRCGTPTYDHLVQQLWHRTCLIESETRP